MEGDVLSKAGIPAIYHIKQVYILILNIVQYNNINLLYEGVV